MLVREQGEEAIVIGQASHAWLSGQLARAWGNERFPAPEPREEVCLAASQHDIGMADWDREPALDPATGWPVSFMDMPLETHVTLWTAAPTRLFSQSHHAALLVSMHGTALYERRNPEQLSAGDRERVAAYLTDQRELQRELIQSLELDEDAVRRNQRLIFTWDGLSLALCLGWERHTLAAVPDVAGSSVDIEVRSLDANHFRLDPWPFSGPELTVRCEARRLSERFEDERRLHSALARARPRTEVYRLTR